MKGMFTKTMRSVMALLLVGCMLFGLCGAALAAENSSGLNDQIVGLLKELEAVLEEYGPKALDTAYTYYKADTAALRAEAKELIIKLEEKLKDYSADEVEALKEAIKDVKDDLKAKKAKLEGMVDDLKAEMAEMEELLANAQGATVMAVAEEDKVDAAINELKAAIEDIKAEIAKYEKMINDAVAEAEAQVKEMEESLTKVFSDLGALREIVAKLKAAMEKAENFTGEDYEEDVEAAVEIMKAAVKDVAGLVDDIKNGTVSVDDAVKTCDKALLALIKDAENYAKNQYGVISGSVDKLMDKLVGDVEKSFNDKVDLLEQRADELEAAAREEFAAKIEEAKAEAKAELEAKIAELEAQYGDAAAEKIAELKAEKEAELEKKVAELQDQADKAAADARADMDAVIEQIPDKIEEAKASVQKMIDDLETSAKNLYAKAEAKAKELYEKLPAMYGKIKEEAQPYIERFKAAYKRATTDDYDIDCCTSYYVAIGDDAAVSESYVDGLAEYLEVEYLNLADNELTAKEAVKVVKANKAEIAKADLITVGFSSATMMYNALDKQPADPNWVNHLGEEGADKFEDALAKLRAELAKIDKNLEAMLGDTLERYAYNCLSYAVNLPALVDEIRQINPDAVVVIVGIYNELENVSVKYGDRTIELGKYFDYVVDASSLHALVYAMVTHNAIFVEADEAETAATGSVLEPQDVQWAYATGDMLPTEAGYEYIKQQIIDSLRITTTGALMGDVDRNGKVNLRDALMLLQYVNGKWTDEDIHVCVSDVDDNGVINLRDALVLLQYVNGKHESLPVK